MEETGHTGQTRTEQDITGTRTRSRLRDAKRERDNGSYDLRGGI